MAALDRPGQTLLIAGVTYQLAAHPVIPGMI
jgi:hypothetical protein